MLLTKNVNVISQKNEAGFILLDMDSGEFYSLYDVSAYIWNCLENGSSQKEIIEKVIFKYEITESQAIEDINKFLNELQAEGLII